jgi:alginate O-acetyltransferase complex protein AlgI
MAIGLGRMLGFRFLENFNFPYVSRSITEFWRRWHISLSSWFRDYLYIPLGGNRKGSTRTYVNLIVVFLLCGLWHGASMSFVVWGLFHGLFLVFERLGLGAFIAKRHAALRHLYVLVVVLVGWVFFRAESLGHALGYLAAMGGLQEGGVAFPFLLHWNSTLALALFAGALGSMPLVPAISAWRERQTRRLVGVAYEASALVVLAVLFFAVALELAAGTYSPFIYFRF